MLVIDKLELKNVGTINDKPSKETRHRYVPAMTWADWELLQAIREEREGLCVDEGCDHHGTPHVCLNVASLNVSAGGTGSGGGPAMNWQAVAADQRDQIADWEVKCKQLEERIESQQQTISSINCENARLSKSLQQYRAAYFADTTPAPQLGGGRGISVGAGGGAASIRELHKSRDALTNFSGGHVKPYDTSPDKADE